MRTLSLCGRSSWETSWTSKSKPLILRSCLQKLIFKTSVFLVMDFLEHDLKTLQEDMLDAFSPSEIKTLILQLTGAVKYLHSNWILHRDLKTSNLLMNNRGQMKVADFGMARYYGDPPPKLTQLVVTLWYRAPELLLGAEKYGAEIDLWSVGCIFGELLTKQPLLQGKNEVDQLAKVGSLVAGINGTMPELIN